MVDSVAMSPIPVGHHHFGCTYVAGFGCLVHLLGGGSPICSIFMVACCTGLGGYPMWVDVHRMKVWLSPPAHLFFRYSVDANSSRVAKEEEEGERNLHTSPFLVWSSLKP